MTSLHLFLLILLISVAHFLDIVTSVITYGTFKPCVYSTRPHERESPLTAHAPLQTDEAFILDALAVVLFCETTGGDSE